MFNPVRIPSSERVHAALVICREDSNLMRRAGRHMGSSRVKYLPKASPSPYIVQAQVWTAFQHVKDTAHHNMSCLLYSTSPWFGTTSRRRSCLFESLATFLLVIDTCIRHDHHRITRLLCTGTRFPKHYSFCDKKTPNCRDYL
jgi:hypothetical protein